MYSFNLASCLSCTPYISCHGSDYFTLPILPTNKNGIIFLYQSVQMKTFPFSSPLHNFMFSQYWRWRLKCYTIWHLKDGGSKLIWKVSKCLQITVSHHKRHESQLPLYVSSVCNKIKHLKLLDSETKSDICIQLAWKPQILFTCYLLMTHTCTGIHMLIFFAYSMSYIKPISNNRKTAVSVQHSFKSILRYLRKLTQL